MKKVFLTLAFVATGIFGAINAQDNAIGLRLGYGGEVSYQRILSDANRLELDLGLNVGYGFNLNGVYQWTWDLSQLATGFNWYAGVGAGLGYWDGRNGGNSYLNVGVLGQVGIEYNFNIPLQLSLDYRPGFYFLGSDPTFWGDGVALGVRYKF
ncbi:MAG: hypothetical protein LBS07_01995 [Prevotellaceae bacterium]|jgi:hypothetical protein|nr:hypothetical protein [Prevotellaceae bacterium]